jgi:hypothetical protein
LGVEVAVGAAVVEFKGTSKAGGRCHESIASSKGVMRTNRAIIPPIAIAGNPPIAISLRNKERSLRPWDWWERPLWEWLGTLSIPRGSVSTFNHQLRRRTAVVKKNVSVNTRSVLIPLVTINDASRTISRISTRRKEANEKVSSLLPTRHREFPCSNANLE